MFFLAGTANPGVKQGMGKQTAPVRIEGHVTPGFESVREAFAENFASRHEPGGACCVYHRGEKVVDIWGSIKHSTKANFYRQRGSNMRTALALYSNGDTTVE